MTKEVCCPDPQKEIHQLSCELQYTQIAIGCILSSLSKRVDLGSVFDEAFETAHEVSKTASNDEGTVNVGRIIESIKAYADIARRSPVLPVLPEEYQGCDVHGIPQDRNHHFNKHYR